MEEKKSGIFIHILAFFAAFILSILIFAGIMGTHADRISQGGLDRDRLAYIRCTGTAAELDVSYENERVVLNWDEIEGCDRYAVYRKKGMDGAYRKIASIEGTSFSDSFKNIPSGEYSRLDEMHDPFCYRVAAVGKDVKSSGIDVCSLRAPVLLSAKRDGMKAALEWSALENAMMYEVYASSSGSDFHQVGSVSQSDPVPSDEFVKSVTRIRSTDRYIKVRAGYCLNGCVVCSGFSRVIDLSSDEEGEIASRLLSISGKGRKYIFPADENKETKENALSVHAEYMNRYADVSWNSVKGASYYVLYRKAGDSEKTWTKVAETGKCSYRDVYKDLSGKLQRRLIVKYLYIDPSINDIRYSVAAYVKDKDGDRLLETSDYGCCDIVRPVVIGAERKDRNVSVTWGCVQNAVRYNIYGAVKNEKGRRVWKILQSVEAASGEKQSEVVKMPLSASRLGVQAVFTYNGEFRGSGYEHCFTTADRNYSKMKMVVLGDSIPYGAPYKDKSCHGIYSYPHRVAEITGMDVSNRSVGGAVYPRRGEILTLLDVADKTDFSRYDVVLMTAGSNDYFYNFELGDTDSTDESTESGAINSIVEDIKEGNVLREKEGKEPTRIVFVDLFYSHRAGLVFGDRFVKKNRIGLTLTDYQNNILKLICKYRKEGIKAYRFTHDIVNGQTYRSMSTDDIHMTKVVYARIGNLLSDFLIDRGIISEDE